MNQFPARYLDIQTSPSTSNRKGTIRKVLIPPDVLFPKDNGTVSNDGYLQLKLSEERIGA